MLPPARTLSTTVGPPHAPSEASVTMITHPLNYSHVVCRPLALCMSERCKWSCLLCAFNATVEDTGYIVTMRSEICIVQCVRSCLLLFVSSVMVVIMQCMQRNKCKHTCVFVMAVHAIIICLDCKCDKVGVKIWVQTVWVIFMILSWLLDCYAKLPVRFTRIHWQRPADLRPRGNSGLLSQSMDSSSHSKTLSLFIYLFQ